MVDLEALKNRGLVPVGQDVPPGEKTIVVVGAARSGTSIVAGVLKKLGIFMGDQAVPPVFEDVRLAALLESSQFEAAAEVVKEYDQRAAVWGFKRPGIIRVIDEMHALLRNPVYLYVFRDPVCIANRNAISMKAEIIPSMREALERSFEMLGFVEKIDAPGLLISTEKSLLHKNDFVDRLVEFLGLDDAVSSDARQQAKDFIAVDPRLYLDSSRLRFAGFLERANPKFVSGWALIRHRAQPVDLEIRINGELVGTIKANRQRQDVREQGLHETGRCGFRFEFPEGQAPRKGDRVAVQFALGGDHLRRSPIVVGAPGGAKAGARPGRPGGPGKKPGPPGRGGKAGGQAKRRPGPRPGRAKAKA